MYSDQYLTDTAYSAEFEKAYKEKWGKEYGAT